MLRIDSHQHFWRLDRRDYHWLNPEMRALYRDFLPQDLAAEIAKAGISKTIAVQAAPSVAETRYLLHLAEATDFVAGVVGWVDMEAADDVLRALSASPYFLGIRPMIQDIPDPNWMLQAALQPAFDSLSRLDLSLDALVRPQHLKPLHTLMQRHPELRVVIDHGAKPDIAANGYQDWVEQLQRIAASTNAHCKLSGLVTEAGDDPDLEHLQPYVDHLLECFGPERLLWGSDWPVVNLASTYADWLALTEQLLAPLSRDERNKIYGGTARAFYRLRFADKDENDLSDAM